MVVKYIYMRILRDHEVTKFENPQLKLAFYPQNYIIKLVI
jgi:hypothetical protein